MNAPHPRVLASRIVSVIQGAKIDVTSEAAAHQAIFDALENDGLNPENEVRLSHRDRVDIIVSDVAVEVKVRGHARRKIYDQVCRYAEHERVNAVVLATGSAWPKSLRKVNGVPFVVTSLSRGWL